MLPSLLARDPEAGLKQFLKTSYYSSDATFEGLVRGYVNERGQDWLKGPYVQLGPPLRVGRGGRDFFQSFQLGNLGDFHEEVAWEGLANDRLVTNTLVATGTGGGKFECFLCSVLEYCAWARAKGRRTSRCW